jgi:hydroxymethylbilane synthase
VESWSPSTEGRAPSGGDEVGVFTRALDEALREDRCDFAVHSLKDLPTAGEADLVLAAVPRRAPVNDALVVASRHAGADGLAGLPQGARVATSSPRRIAQVKRARPDVTTVPMAGNVDTRLRKLEAGDADALLLAAAGLERLGRAEVISRRLPPLEFLPAPGQGALAVVCRVSATDVQAALATQEDFAARATALAERAVLNALRGGCRAPVGVHAAFEGGRLTLAARVLSVDGRESLDESADAACASVADAEGLGRAVAERLLSRGADRLVGAARES